MSLLGKLATLALETVVTSIAGSAGAPVGEAIGKRIAKRLDEKRRKRYPRTKAAAKGKKPEPDAAP